MVDAFIRSLAAMDDEARRSLLSRDDAVVANVFDLLESGATNIGPEIDWGQRFQGWAPLADEACPWVTQAATQDSAEAEHPTSRSAGRLCGAAVPGHPHAPSNWLDTLGLLEIRDEVISDGQQLLEWTFALADRELLGKSVAVPAFTETQLILEGENVELPPRTAGIRRVTGYGARHS